MFFSIQGMSENITIVFIKTTDQDNWSSQSTKSRNCESPRKIGKFYLSSAHVLPLTNSEKTFR